MSERKQITLRLAENQYEALEKLAKNKQLSVNSLVVNALWQYVNQY
ncbi:hypothetical protein [Lactobacillus jensenii]|nr:hypothetical protein [Lactobacillus jensenii]ERJ44150.1 hypothetical protein N581_07960 [Lactobacillus jensenii MD IIE-70(2)]MCF1843633.1 hypothetical protein [Lactobacillus jensenii]DAQ86149.1 MAG TPA: antitoxin [Caudoviricetes sp.]